MKCEICEKEIKAIENLLKRYKELKEENKNARNEIIKIINTPEAIKNSINELRTNQFIGENVKLVILNYIDKITTENEQYKKQFEDIKNNILVPSITEKNFIPISVIQNKITEEIKYHEKNISDIETITMFQNMTPKEQAEIEFNKYALVVLNQFLSKLLEERNK